MKSKGRFPVFWFRKGLFSIMWSSGIADVCSHPLSRLVWGSRIKYGITILPRDIWIHIWLPKWCKGRGYYISIGLWLFSIQRGY